MKKIGLLSFHKDSNYGTMYQAYALVRAIQKLGANAEYLNYEAIPYRNPIKTLMIRFVKSVLCFFNIRKNNISEYSFLNTKEFSSLKSKFKKFHDKYIPTSKETYYLNTIHYSENKYEFFIVGSDQTWSPFCNANPHTPFYLSFIKDNSKKRAYAPSIGSTHITNEYRLKLKNELSTFKNLSCREYQNCIMLHKTLGKHVEYVLDPTLLISDDEWRTLEEYISMPSKYILCYILGTKKCISDYAEQLGRIKNIPVYYMVTRPEYLTKNNILKDVSPEQFLWLLRNSSYVVTDSFHGSMFSINFKKNFFSFSKRETNDVTGIDNDRIMDFLSVFKLEDRFINDSEERIPSDIDYTLLEEQLSKMRSSSISYLRTIIK